MEAIVNLKFEIPVAEHTELKLLVVRRRTTLTTVLREMVREYLAKAQQDGAAAK